MLSDAIHHGYTRVRAGLLLRGLIALALGIFILARPLDSVAAFALVVAIWALVSGIAQIVDAVELRSAWSNWWVLLLGGIVSVGFGVAALYYYPALSLVFAVVWVSYWLLLSGVVGIYIAMQERKMHTAWGWTAAFGAISVLAGVYALLVPPATLVALMGLISAFAIVGGILLLVAFFKIGAAKTDLASAVAGARS
jgi:uncharacterized membrane protein HdeD (DUF308 family)